MVKGLIFKSTGEWSHSVLILVKAVTEKKKL